MPRIGWTVLPIHGRSGRGCVDNHAGARVATFFKVTNSRSCNQAWTSKFVSLQSGLHFELQSFTTRLPDLQSSFQKRCFITVTTRCRHIRSIAENSRCRQGQFACRLENMSPIVETV